VQLLFGDYGLDIARRELKRGSELISLGPQVFDLLVYLVENRERVVSKDDLIEAIWGGRIVSESTLTSHINAVRKAVGDSGEEQKLIRTVPRKVSVSSSMSMKSRPLETTAQRKRPSRRTPPSGHRPRQLAHRRLLCPTSRRLPSCRSKT
jgi:DNA-binding winged helix-turn-helix (wHTH) protein